MAEVRFYQLTSASLERVLPEMLEKSVERGWRAVVRCGSPQVCDMLDAALWTYRDDAFLPHGTSASPAPEREPVYLTTGAEMPNRPDVLFLVDGAAAARPEIASLGRTCLIFDGGDAAALDAARAAWADVRAAELSAEYWAQERGRWVLRQESKRP